MKWQQQFAKHSNNSNIKELGVQFEDDFQFNRLFYYSNRFFSISIGTKRNMERPTHITRLRIHIAQLYESGSFLSNAMQCSAMAKKKKRVSMERLLQICNIENGNWIKCITSCFLPLLRAPWMCVCECWLHLKSHGMVNQKIINSGSLASYLMNVSMCSTSCTARVFTDVQQV